MGQSLGLNFTVGVRVIVRVMMHTIRSKSMLLLAVFDEWDYTKVAGGSAAEWLACWTQAHKGPGSNRSRDAVR